MYVVHAIGKAVAVIPSSTVASSELESNPIRGLATSSVTVTCMGLDTSGPEPSWAAMIKHDGLICKLILLIYIPCKFSRVAPEMEMVSVDSGTK